MRTPLRRDEVEAVRQDPPWEHIYANAAAEASAKRWLNALSGGWLRLERILHGLVCVIFDERTVATAPDGLPLHLDPHAQIAHNLVEQTRPPKEEEKPKPALCAEYLIEWLANLTPEDKAALDALVDKIVQAHDRSIVEAYRT